MDWNGLKNFLAIANSGSLSEAAKLLGVNHSTVYRRLHAFEKEIGNRLFNLVNNHYQLTTVGKELLDLAEGIAAEFDNIERHIAGKDFLPKGVVKITASFNLANRYIPRALSAFRSTYPDICIEMLSSNLEVNMNSRIADIAVRATNRPPEHLVGRKVARIPWGIFASTEYLIRAGEINHLEDLSNHTLIGGSGPMLNLPAFAWLEKHYGQQVKTRADELTAMFYFAHASQGVAFLPLDQQRPNIEYLGEFSPGKTSDLWILTHPDLRHTERVKLVMECLYDYFKKQTPFKLP